MTIPRSELSQGQQPADELDILTGPVPPYDQPGWRAFLTSGIPLSLGVSVGAVIIALLVGAALVAGAGASPFSAYNALFQGAFVGWGSLTASIAEATPLALIGMGLALAFRAGAFNIGAEGQFYVGAVAGTIVALHLGSVPGPLALAVMAVASMLGGATWALAPAVMRIVFNANEVLTTIMGNYIAILLVSYLLEGPIQEPGVTNFGTTRPLPSNVRLPTLLHGSSLQAGALVALVAVVVCHVLLYRTNWGYRVRVTGKNVLVARSGGIRSKAVFASAFAISGALAGLAGFVQVAGVQYRMIEGLSPGYGYIGIVVALLGGTTPFGALVAGVLFGALDIGGLNMQTTASVPQDVVTTIEYLIVLIVIASAFLRVRRQKAFRKEAV